MKKFSVVLVALILFASIIVPSYADSARNLYTTERSALQASVHIAKSGSSYSHPYISNGVPVRLVQDVVRSTSTINYGEIMNHGGIDGSYGSHSKAAVKNIQPSGSKDGIVGPYTWGLLADRLQVYQTVPYSNYTEAFIKLDPDQAITYNGTKVVLDGVVRIFFYGGSQGGIYVWRYNGTNIPKDSNS